jgi:urease accessory protein
MMERLERYGRLAALSIVAAVALWPAAAWAHTASGEAGGFLTGIRHPVSGLDHVLAMLAVGLWGAQLGVPAVWLLPVAFPMMMAFGGMFGLMGLPLPGVEMGIAVSAVVLGIMVSAEARPPLWVALSIVTVFSVFHGHAHGTELPEGQSGLFYSMGFVIATGLLHGVGIGIGSIHRWDAGRVALRVAGAVVLVAGIFFFWNALT